MLKSWAKNYSIFLRKICFGKEDSFFLPLPRVFPAASVVFLGLLTFTASTGLAKGEISLISTGGGDQELPFPVFLKERYTQVGAAQCQVLPSADRRRQPKYSCGPVAGRVKVPAPTHAHVR